MRGRPHAQLPDHGLVAWLRAPAGAPASATNYQPSFRDAAWQKCEQLVPGQLGEPAGDENRRRRLGKIDRPTSLSPFLNSAFDFLGQLLQEGAYLSDRRVGSLGENPQFAKRVMDLSKGWRVTPLHGV